MAKGVCFDLRDMVTWRRTREALELKAKHGKGPFRVVGIPLLKGGARPDTVSLRLTDTLKREFPCDLLRMVNL